MSMRHGRRAVRAGWQATVVALFVLTCAAAALAQTTPPAQAAPTTPRESSGLQGSDLLNDLRIELRDAVKRLPWAAMLGTVLALRPRRGGSPPRDPAVIETQIVLAIVGSLIMLVVGASLARAFGIAGAASLIRYRARIEDPKDAVVMLSALSVGLASGVGLFAISAAATGFLVLTLFIIEGFEHRVRTFLLTIKLGERTSARRAEVERILRRAQTVFELRTTSDDELSYLVNAHDSLKTETLSAALSALAKDGKAQIEWKEEKKTRPLAETEEE